MARTTHECCEQFLHGPPRSMNLHDHRSRVHRARFDVFFETFGSLLVHTRQHHRANFLIASGVTGGEEVHEISVRVAKQE